MSKKPDGITCVKHGGNPIVLSNFYVSGSRSVFSGVGYIPICKRCLYKMVEEYYHSHQQEMRVAIYLMCRKIDVGFDNNIFEGSFKGDDISPTKVFMNYMTQYNSLGIKNGTMLPFDYGEDIATQQSSNKDKASSDDFDSCYDSIEDLDQTKVYSKQWMGEYAKHELEYLGNYYTELQKDFKIITKNHKDYAKKIAKASLAMDLAYEDMRNGATGSDKRYKDLKDAFDSLSKSAQFAEDKRGLNDVSLGGFGVVFERVEQNQWVPEHTPITKDDYDQLIEAFSTIKKSV